MKSKKNLYILLAAVVIIWGLIIYRIIANVSFSADIPQNFSSTIQPINEQIKLDSFSIQANYRDPFLGKYIKKEVKKPVAKTGVKKVVKQPVLNIISPKYNVRYKGIIANKNAKNSLAVLTIDGKELLMQKSDKYKDLTLLSIAKDSVLIGAPNGNFYVKRK